MFYPSLVKCDKCIVSTVYKTVTIDYVQEVKTSNTQSKIYTYLYMFFLFRVFSFFIFFIYLYTVYRKACNIINSFYWSYKWRIVYSVSLVICYLLIYFPYFLYFSCSLHSFQFSQDLLYISSIEKQIVIAFNVSKAPPLDPFSLFSLFEMKSTYYPSEENLYVTNVKIYIYKYTNSCIYFVILLFLFFFYSFYFPVSITVVVAI